MAEGSTSGDDRNRDEDYNGPSQIPEESPASDDELALDKQRARIRGEDTGKDE